MPDVVGRVFDAKKRDLADRNEGANAADFAFQAAGVRAGDAGLDERAFGDVGPVAAGDERAAGNRQQIEVVLHVVAGDDHIDHVAGIRRLDKVAEARHALILAAEGKEHVVAVHVDDLCPVREPFSSRLASVFRSAATI